MKRIALPFNFNFSPWQNQTQGREPLVQQNGTKKRQMVIAHGMLAATIQSSFTDNLEWV